MPQATKNTSTNRQFCNLIDDLQSFINEHVYLVDGDALLLAHYVLLTHHYSNFITVPYLSVESHSKGHGKTTLLRVMEKVCLRPISSTAITEAGVFRILQDYNTLFIDEAEGIDQQPILRKVLNSGYAVDGRVIRCHPKTNAPEVFRTFGPKILASIGGQGGTLGDRCIPIVMAKVPSNHQLRRIKPGVTDREADVLKQRLKHTAKEFSVEVFDLCLGQPDSGYWPGLHGRHAELFEPLLTIAKAASPQLEERLLPVVMRKVAARQKMQSEDVSNLLVYELIEAIDELIVKKGTVVFQPNDLLGSLAQSDNWGARFEKCAGPRGRATSVGRFLTAHGVPQLGHTRSGAKYSNLEARRILCEQLTPVKEIDEVTL